MDTELERLYQFFRGYWPVKKGEELSQEQEAEEDEDKEQEASEEEEAENDECVDDDDLDDFELAVRLGACPAATPGQGVPGISQPAPPADRPSQKPEASGLQVNHGELKIPQFVADPEPLTRTARAERIALLKCFDSIWEYFVLCWVLFGSSCTKSLCSLCVLLS